MHEQITGHARVVVALDALPEADRERARRALESYLEYIGTAESDELSGEATGGPGRAPHYRASWAALLRKETHRRAALAVPSWTVFEAATMAAEESGV
jgi:hypothetical protein